ncbi:hypothetical protein FJY63_01295, partial [Candidatus Sumerlaeota bacterium]|nr:hypothetical protein [Candidatus Sumerlaeota bacterium]
MLDFQSSSKAPKYALGVYDEVIVDGVSYRPHARRDWGFVFVRTDGKSVAESFDDGKIAHLVQKGLLTHRVDAFLPEEMRHRQKSETTILSSLDGRQADELAMRLAFVEALLEAEVAGKVTRTDASMQAAMFRIQRRAMEILFEKPVKRGQAGRREETVQPPSAGTLRKWVRSFEKKGAIGLCDAKHRSGNRSCRIGLKELAVMSPIVASYASGLRPTVKYIYKRICAAFEEVNNERKVEGLSPLVVPSRESVRRRIRKLDPYHTCLAREGAAVARKKFAPVAQGLRVTRPLERVEIDEWKVDLMTLFAEIGLLDHLTAEEKAELGFG